MWSVVLAEHDPWSLLVQVWPPFRRLTETASLCTRIPSMLIIKYHVPNTSYNVLSTYWRAHGVFPRYSVGNRSQSITWLLSSKFYDIVGYSWRDLSLEYLSWNNWAGFQREDNGALFSANVDANVIRVCDCVLMSFLEVLLNGSLLINWHIVFWSIYVHLNRLGVSIALKNIVSGLWY